MDLIGIEPMTSSMPWKRAPSCATGPHGGMQLFYCLCLAGIRQTLEGPGPLQPKLFLTIYKYDPEQIVDGR